MSESILWQLSRKKTGISRWMRDKALAYLQHYNDFNYNFETNGESFILKKLSQFSFRTVFDVGANTGKWTEQALVAFPQATIHAFELSESTRSKLKKSLASPRCIISEFALGAEESKVEYKDYGDQAQINTLIKTANFHDALLPFTIQTAKVMMGDTYMASANVEEIDFLKLDVEGSEFQVLEGFSQSLKDHKIHVIQFEYGYHHGDEGHLMKDFYNLLSNAEYEVGKIWTAGVRFSPFEYSMNNFDSGPNYLAVARSKSAIINSLRSPV